MRSSHFTVDRLLGDPAERGDPLWWWDHAHCRGRRRLFTEVRSGPLEPARVVCEACLCQNVCAWFALSLEPYDLRFHVYGGLSPTERQVFVERHRITPEWARTEYAVARNKLWRWLLERDGCRQTE